MDWDDSADLKSPLKENSIFDESNILEDSYKSLEARIFTRRPVARRLDIQDLESEETPLLLVTDSVSLFVYLFSESKPRFPSWASGGVQTLYILPVTTTYYARVGKVSRSLCKTSGLVILPRESEFQPAA